MPLRPPSISHSVWTPAVRHEAGLHVQPIPKGRDSQMTNQRSEIRIYVACLAAYNNGILHGSWIDANQDAWAIWGDVSAMLRASPVEDAEEWAIHDYEGFEGAPISEWTSFETIAALADFIGEHETLGGKLLEHYGGDLEDAKAALEEYAGEFESLADYARDLTEQTGTEIPAHLARYIDYAAMAHDMEMGGDVFTIETGFNQVHVFWAR